MAMQISGSPISPQNHIGSANASFSTQPHIP